MGGWEYLLRDQFMEIYIIRNKVNDKVYIGQTVRGYLSRFKEHIDKIRKYPKYDHPLYNSIRKYGVDKFYVELLKTCNSIEDLNYWEEFYIKEFNSIAPNGYNLLPGGNNRKHNQLTKDKIKAEMAIRIQTKEFEDKCVKPLINYVKSNEGREELREIAHKEWSDPIYREKQKEARKENMYNDRWKQNISNATKDAMFSPKHREKYLRGYIKYLIKRFGRKDERLAKFLIEYKQYNKKYRKYCENAFIGKVG